MNFRFANARVRSLLAGWTLLLLPVLAACETDSYLDPSRTGYFETTPTAIPILTRIDVIEQDSELGKPTQPAPEDLVPNTLDYRLAPGDAIKVSIPRLISATDTDISERAVDQAGRITLPIIGTMQAAEALKLHQKYYPMFRDLFIETNPVPTKAALAMLGRCAEEYRLPLCKMSAANRAQLARTLKDCGVLKK